MRHFFLSIAVVLIVPATAIRLLNIYTEELSEFYGNATPPYAIASHRWYGDEATYDDVLNRRNTNTAGYRKIRDFIHFTRKFDTSIEWLWIDTCCIDKRSSAELSEAINSMFQWYAEAEYCLAYIYDAESVDDLKASVWFKRGWTLQELLAPRTVILLAENWKILGFKGAATSLAPNSLHNEKDLTARIADISSIPETILYDYKKSAGLSVEEKLFWLQHRQTTRPEDMVYCMLGILEVSLAPIYGEGNKAFGRLAQALLQRQEYDVGTDQIHAESARMDISRMLATAALQKVLQHRDFDILAAQLEPQAARMFVAKRMASGSSWEEAAQALTKEFVCNVVKGTSMSDAEVMDGLVFGDCRTNMELSQEKHANFSPAASVALVWSIVQEKLGFGKYPTKEEIEVQRQAIAQWLVLYDEEFAHQQLDN